MAHKESAHFLTLEPAGAGARPLIGGSSQFWSDAREAPLFYVARLESQVAKRWNGGFGIWGSHLGWLFGKFQPIFLLGVIRWHIGWTLHTPTSTYPLFQLGGKLIGAWRRFTLRQPQRSPSGAATVYSILIWVPPDPFSEYSRVARLFKLTERGPRTIFYIGHIYPLRGGGISAGKKGGPPALHSHLSVAAATTIGEWMGDPRSFLYGRNIPLRGGGYFSWANGHPGPSFLGLPLSGGSSISPPTPTIGGAVVGNHKALPQSGDPFGPSTLMGGSWPFLPTSTRPSPMGTLLGFHPYGWELTFPFPYPPQMGPWRDASRPFPNRGTLSVYQLLWVLSWGHLLRPISSGEKKMPLDAQSLGRSTFWPSYPLAEELRCFISVTF